MATRSKVESAIAKLDFEPSKPTGSTKDREWSYDDDEEQTPKGWKWKQLYDVCADLKTSERNELCKKYFVSYQTVRSKTGNMPAKAQKPQAQTKAPDDRLTPAELRKLLEDEISQYEREIEKRKSELSKLDKLEHLFADDEMTLLIQR